jgi:hypothetical protein
MSKFSKLSLLFLGILTAVAACNPASTSTGSGGNTPDPIVAHWVLSSVTNGSGSSQAPLSAGIAEDVVFNADKSIVVGVQIGASWGIAETLVAVGTWTPGSSGSYSFTAYPSSGTGSSVVTGTVTLGGSTLSAPNNNGPAGGPWTFTFTKSSVSISSSDPLRGTWVLNSVTDKNNLTSSPSSLSLAETAVFEGDSSFLFGEQDSGQTMCGAGIWTPGSPGSYSFTAYPGIGTSTAAGTATLGGSILTVPNINIGSPLDPYTFSFVKSSATISQTDPLLGAWTLTSVTDNNNSTQTAASAGLQQVVVFQGDGSLIFGAQDGVNWGNSVECGIGFWTPGSSGSYSYTAYTAGGASPSTGTATLGGSILTIAGVGGGLNPPNTLKFTKM